MSRSSVVLAARHPKTNGSLSIFVGRHGAMKPAVRIRCNMRAGANLPSAYRQSARLIDKFLKGASPADLPVEVPTRFELIVNLKAAKAIGLTIPDAFVSVADEVIE